MQQKKKTFEVLFEDNHLLVVIKPPMMPVQADQSGDADLLSLCKEYIKEAYNKPGAVYLGLAHRLDRPVGGVMVFARTSKAAARLQKQMQSGTWEKKYLAIVEGKAEESADLRDFLWKDEKSHSSIVIAEKEKGKEARLSYRKIAYQDSLSCLEIGLETGRHHQIRVQLSSRELPIWGDARYNSKSKPGQNIALWAYSLVFEHPVLKKTLCFRALPECKDRWVLFYDAIRELEPSC